MWRCKQCETYNDDQSCVCEVCSFPRTTDVLVEHNKKDLHTVALEKNAAGVLMDEKAREASLSSEINSFSGKKKRKKRALLIVLPLLAFFSTALNLGILFLKDTQWGYDDYPIINEVFVRESYRDAEDLSIISKNSQATGDNKNGREYSQLVVDNNILVEIKDKVIEKNIRDQLGIYERDLTQSDLNRIEILEIHGSELTDLEILQQCANIKILVMNDCDLQKIPDLQGLKNLAHIDFSDNEIKEIKDFPKLNSLEFISLMNNPLCDISGLGNLGDEVFIELAEIPAHQGSAYNDQVRQIQALLIEKNYLYDNADGRYGPKTQNAIKTMQKDAGLPQTGAVDQETIHALAKLGKTDFVPVGSNRFVIYNTYLDSEGKLHFRVKNVGKSDIQRLEVAGQQLNSNYSPLCSLRGKGKRHDRFDYYWWEMHDNKIASGKTRSCHVLLEDESFERDSNTAYYRLWPYSMVNENGKTIWLYSNDGPPSSWIIGEM